MSLYRIACRALPVLAALTASAVVAGPAAAAAPARHLVLYSFAEQEQYINNSDSASRGQGNNPFGNYKDLAPLVNKNSNGPFPGDEALFSFNLYSNPTLKTKVGAAIFTCQYSFNKNAYCDVSFQLAKGGTLIASGSFDFNASNFSLAVTGGYGSYEGSYGTMQETPSAHHAQKLTFQFS